MEDIRQYLLSVTAAAIICSIVIGFLGKKGSYGIILKLIAGLFLATTVVAPWVKIDLLDFSSYTEGLASDADAAVFQGEVMANEATAAIIKSNTEAYILDKAVSMGLDIEVEVTLGNTSPPVPVGVSIKGAVSPYAKDMMQRYLTDDLGIPEENQLWK